MVSASASFTGPQYYNDCLGPLWFEFFAADLAQRLPKEPSGDVLEIACGTGIVTIKLRERLDPSVRLVATDVSRPMLDYARARLDDRSDIEWREADALALPFDDNEFAAVVCGFGMMFMPDRAAALREARRVLGDGAILLFNVWDRIGKNLHAFASAQVLEALFPRDHEMSFRRPYEMGDAGQLRRLLADTGFRETRIDTKRVSITGADPLRLAIGLIRGTPRATLIEQRGGSPDNVIAKVRDALARTGGDPYHGQAQAVIVEALAI